MSQVDFQNGFVVGMALGGKNGTVGGVEMDQSVLIDCMKLITIQLVPEMLFTFTADVLTGVLEVSFTVV